MVEKQTQTKMDESWNKIKQKLKQPTEEKTEDEYPPIVDWKETPEIMGTIERLRYTVTTYNPEAPICDMRKPDGELVSFWITTVLKTKFERLKIKEGDRIGIKCLGKREKKRYYDFNVVVE